VRVPHSSTTAAADASTDQCGLPLSKRHGAWQCRSAATGAPSGASPTATTPGGTSYCTTNGCWQRGDDFHSNYSTDVYFGWNSKNLGYVYIEFDWQLVGNRTYGNPVLAIFYPNPGVGILGVDMNGSLYNGAPGVANGGSRITSVVWSPHYGPGTSYRWTSWSAADSTNWDHNSINEVQWTVSGTSGYYYAWGRSICTHTTDKKIYRYDSASSLPGNPTGTGWVS
jgi:hypothetical protein